MNILISDPIEQRCVDILTREGFHVDVKTGLAPEELKNIIGGYAGLVVRSSTKVKADIIAEARAMKVIGRAGAGVDNIDVGAASRRGIIVMNTPGGNTISTAEHTVSMMMALARNIPQAQMSLVAGRWDRKKYTGTELLGKTLAIVGIGKIGREVASRMRAFGMTVIGFDPVLGSDVAMKIGIELVSLEEVYRRADFITVHTPLNDETRGLLNERTIALCKKGVRIINCARGGIVDEQALLNALNSGHVAGAALDVFVEEPPKNVALVQHPHVVATPHLGASTEEAQEKVAIQIAEQMADALHERAYNGIVNDAVMHLTLKPEVRPYVILAEKLGRLAARLAVGHVKKVTIGGAGDIVISTMELMKAGVLKGILSLSRPERVNFVSAPFLAAESGLALAESRETSAGDYANLLRIRVETDEGDHECAGTVFGSASIRLVMIDGFRFEVVAEGHLLTYYNIDKPGMLAQVGSILAQHQVNIAGLSLGRTAAGERALTVVNVDSPVPPEALDLIRAVPGVMDIKVIDLL